MIIIRINKLLSRRKGRGGRTNTREKRENLEIGKEGDKKNRKKEKSFP